MRTESNPTTPKVAESKTINLPNIQLGDQGQTVKLAQKILIANRYLGSDSFDGNFGQKTEQAVKNYQHSHSLVVDGVVGVQTWEKLIKDIHHF